LNVPKKHKYIWYIVDKFHSDKTNVLKISLKYDRKPLSQCNKQGSILHMYMTYTCVFLYIQKNVRQH